MHQSDLRENEIVKANGLEPLLTVAQAAQWLGLKEKRVHELVRKQKLACVQISVRERRFLPSQLQEFMRSRVVTPPKRVDAIKPVPLLSAWEMKSRGEEDRAQLRREMRQWR